MAVNRLPFKDVSLKDEETSINVKKERKVKRIVHFSDGVLEEYSTDEEDVPDSTEKKKFIDPKTLAWIPYIWFHMANLGSKTLSVCDYLGERIAWMLGITSPKYQYELDEAKRMAEEEEKERQKEDEEYAGWKTKSATDGTSSEAYFSQPTSVTYDQELNKDAVQSISSSAEVASSNIVSHSFDKKPIAVHQTDVLSAGSLVDPNLLHSSSVKQSDVSESQQQNSVEESVPIPEVVKHVETISEIKLDLAEESDPELEDEVIEEDMQDEDVDLEENDDDVEEKTEEYEESEEEVAEQEVSDGEEVSEEVKVDDAIEGESDEEIEVLEEDEEDEIIQASSEKKKEVPGSDLKEAASVIQPAVHTLSNASAPEPKKPIENNVTTSSNEEQTPKSAMKTPEPVQE